MQRVFSPVPNPRRASIVVALMLSAVFLLTTIRGGQPWDGDAELYIRHGLNILSGLPYGTTAYIVNPADPLHPAAYPPGLPLLLLPVLAALGVDYVAIKATLIVCFLAFLVVLAWLARHSLSPRRTGVLILALGFNPFIWAFKDVVYSEFAFLLFAYAGLAGLKAIELEVLRSATTPGRRGEPLWWLIALTGLALAAALATRTAGIALIASAGLIALMRRDRVAQAFALSLAVAIVVRWALALAFPSDVQSYTSNLERSWLDLALGLGTNGWLYLGAAPQLLIGPGEAPLIARVLAGALLGLAGMALLRHAFARIDVIDAFVVISIAMLLIYPVAEEPARYALPILPALALRAFQVDWGRWLKPGMALLLAIYGVGLADRPADDGLSVDSPGAQALYQAVREVVPSEDVILAAHPTVIGLFTARHATNPRRVTSEAEFWDLAARTHAHWLIVQAAPGPDGLRALLPSLKPRLEAVYANEEFQLLKLKLPGEGA